MNEIQKLAAKVNGTFTPKGAGGQLQFSGDFSFAKEIEREARLLWGWDNVIMFSDAAGWTICFF